jgi:hypothetical protein
MLDLAEHTPTLAEAYGRESAAGSGGGGGPGMGSGQWAGAGSSGSLQHSHLAEAFPALPGGTGGRARVGGNAGR